MIKLRIGKTLSIRWKLKNNGAPISSDDKITLFTTDSVGRKYKLPIHSITDGCVYSSFSPTLQTRIGVYSLTIWKDYGTPDQCPVDAINAFELVPFSNMEECAFQPGDPVVVIESCLAIGAQATINGYNTITIKGDPVQQEGPTLTIDSYSKSQTYSKDEADKLLESLKEDLKSYIDQSSKGVSFVEDDDDNPLTDGGSGESANVEFVEDPKGNPLDSEETQSIEYDDTDISDIFKSN